VQDSGAAISFEQFLSAAEPRLRQLLISLYGPLVGAEALAEAMAVGWERRTQLLTMSNPEAYLFTVARNWRRRQSRRRCLQEWDLGTRNLPSVEPGLRTALLSLSPRQRTVVLLTDGYEWRVSEVAEALGISASSVRNHRERGLKLLRKSLGVDHE
jgi:DNA-directed RNA polymerase specialized sigma24 family protein